MNYHSKLMTQSKDNYWIIKKFWTANDDHYIYPTNETREFGEPQAHTELYKYNSSPTLSSSVRTDQIMATTTYFPDQSAPNMPTETNFETQLKNDPDAYLDHLLNDLLSNPPTPSRPLSPCMDSRPDHSISSILGSPTHNQDYATGLQSLLKPNIIGMSDQTIKQPVATSPKVQLCGIETRESDLHKSLQLLQLSFPIEVQYMSSYYRYQSALIENNRYQAFYYHHPSSYGYLNSYYDSQLHHLIETVQVSIKRNIRLYNQWRIKLNCTFCNFMCCLK